MSSYRSFSCKQHGKTGVPMLDMLNVEYVCVYCQLENKKKPQKNFPDEDVLILCTEVPGIERE